MSTDATMGHTALYTGAVYDVLRARSLERRAALPKEIAPLDPSHLTVGPAFTVTGRIVDDVDDHESLLRWTEMLSAAPAGSVLVCQPHDDTIAHMGELSAETLQGRGVLGCVIDGGCRDTAFIVDAGFPVWCRYRTPADVVGRWIATGLDIPIEIGDVPIAPGDVIVADRDGVVRVPAGVAADVLAEAEALAATESEVRRAIRQGMDPKEAYLRYGAF